MNIVLDIGLMISRWPDIVVVVAPIPIGASKGRITMGIDIISVFNPPKESEKVLEWLK